MASEHVCNRESHRGGRVSFISTQPHDARSRLSKQVLARTVAPHFCIAVTRHNSIYDTVVNSRDVAVAETKALDHSRTEVLHHYVRPRKQLAQLFLVIGILQVSCITFLVAIDGVKQSVLAVNVGVAEVNRPSEVA